MQPKWMILDAQVSCPLIKWRNAALILKNNLEHVNDNYSTKTQKQGQSVQNRTPSASTDLFGIVFLINWCLVDDNRAGAVAGGDTRLLLNVKNLTPTQPIERFLQQAYCQVTDRILCFAFPA